MTIWIRDYAKDVKRNERAAAATTNSRKPKLRPIRKEIHIRTTLPSGERYELRKVPGMTSESAAQRWAEQHIAEVLKRRAAVPSVANREPPPTLAEFEERYFSEYCEPERQKPTTLATKRSIFKIHLLPIMGQKRLDTIDASDVQLLKKALAASSVSHLNNALSTLSTVLKFAMSMKVIDKPGVDVKLLKNPEREMGFYGYGEYERLVSGAAECDPRILVTVLLGGDAGLRRGEMLALTWAQVHFDRSVLVVANAMSRQKRLSTKAGNVRNVVMSDRLAAALKVLSRGKNGDRVLCRDNGAPATGRVLQRWIERAEKAAGMPPTGRLHVLRHSFVSHLTMAGVPAYSTQRLAGHKSLVTTMRYMHLSPEAGQEAIRALQKHRQLAGGNREQAEDKKETA